MAEKIPPKDLEALLARLREEWQELADLLISQGKSRDRVIEVEKILLRDAEGHHRGKISADPDGSAELLLSDRAGHAWVRLGVNRDGEAFIELKDQKGESSFGDANSAIFERLDKLARRYRRLKFFGILVLGLFGVILATQAYVVFRPHLPGYAGEALVVRDSQGNIRASLRGAGDQVGLDLWDAQGRRRVKLGLGAGGAPGLAFYDQEQRVRAELNLGPDGEPKFTLRDQRGLETQKEAKSPADSARPRPPGETGQGAEAGARPSPPAGPAEAVSPKGDAEAEVEYVGSKTSNKYHDPNCKWAKRISPSRVIKFKSVKEAQEHGYIPCPVCKPSPLSR